MPELIFFEKQISKVYCSLKNDKLTFSWPASRKLKLAEFKYIKLGHNANNPNDNYIYLITTNDKDSQCFILRHTGPTFYISNIDADTLQLNNTPIIFNITDCEPCVFKLKQRKS